MKHFFIAFALALTTQMALAQDTKTIKVLDATIKDAVVPDADVFIQKNGARTVIGKTDANGNMLADGIGQNDENTLLIIQKPGYSTLVVKCPCWGYTYALSPTMKDEKDIRVVLSWGAQPMDLDIHAVFSNTSNEPQHVYFGNKKAGNIMLDVDDQDGHGPETITINGSMQSGYFFVRDYTNRQKLNTQLSRSDAKVFVYKGNELIRTYYVPDDTEGNIWMLFQMEANGNIIDHSVVSFTAELDGEEEETERGSSTAEPQNSYLSDGEAAYRAREYERSLKLYQKALNEEPGINRSVVYNNMALCYLKLNKFQNVVLYCEKAIEANEQSGGQTLAASYYNMGLAFEKQHRYKEAAQNFQKAANAYPDNAVYLNALKRVRKLIK